MIVQLRPRYELPEVIMIHVACTLGLLKSYGPNKEDY